MGGHLIEQTETYKYLGVTIDENLNWVPQIDKLCCKLASVCGILSKARHYLDRKPLLLIYNSLVESRLRYGLLSWSTATKTQLQRIQVLQNKALRFIHFASIDTRMLPIYAHYKVLPLDQLMVLQQANYMYCFSNNLLPSVFKSYCHKPLHSYKTRYSKYNFQLAKQESRYVANLRRFLGRNRPLLLSIFEFIISKLKWL